MSRPQPKFDAEKIVTWLGAYLRASDEADRVGLPVKVKGHPFKVCPTRDRKTDLE